MLFITSWGDAQDLSESWVVLGWCVELILKASIVVLTDILIKVLIDGGGNRLLPWHWSLGSEDEGLISISHLYFLVRVGKAQKVGSTYWRFFGLIIIVRVFHRFPVIIVRTIDQIWRSWLTRTSIMNCHLRDMLLWRFLKDTTAAKSPPMRLDNLTTCQSAALGNQTFHSICLFLDLCDLLVWHIKLEWFIRAVRIGLDVLIDQLLVLRDDVPGADHFFELCAWTWILAR